MRLCISVSESGAFFVLLESLFFSYEKTFIIFKKLVH